MKAINWILNPIPIACKIIYVVSLILFVIGLIISAVPLALANYPEKIYYDYQLYRLLVTFLSKGDSVLGIIAIVFDFLMIRFFFTKLETKYSTVFFTMSILIQNLTFQIFFTLIAGIFLWMDVLTSFLISYGWTPLIVILIYQYAYKDKQEKFKITCIQIEKKYIPFIMIVFAIVFAFDQFICILAAILFGYLQFGLYGKNFISLPLGFYKKIESCIPQCIKNRQDFKKVEDCQAKILEQCSKQSTSAPKQQKIVEFTEEKKQQESKQKKIKKRKTSRIKNSTSGSMELGDDAESGKSTKDGELDGGLQVPNMETNNYLGTELKL